jgi:hypothetical protein
MNEMDVFRNLVLAQFDKYNVVRDDDAKVQSLLEEISLNFAPFADRGMLESNLPNADHPNTDFLKTRQFLYLPPIKAFSLLLPVLRVKAEFDRERQPEVRLRVTLFLRDRAQKRLRYFGYRFESPELRGPNREVQEGRHDYYHAQLIHVLGDSRSHPGGEQCWPEWLPLDQPAFALDADCSVSLLISLLVSLYGLEYIDKLLLVDGSSAYLDPLHVQKFRPTFWKVQFQKGTYYYKVSPDISSRHLKLQLSSPPNPVSKCTQISLDTYYAMDKDRRKCWPEN